jgi:hypothetical protein
MSWTPGCHTVFHHRNHIVWVLKYCCKVLQRDTGMNTHYYHADFRKTRCGYFRRFPFMISCPYVCQNDAFGHFRMNLQNC